MKSLEERGGGGGNGEENARNEGRDKTGGLGLGKRVIKRYDIRHRARTCGQREGKERVGQTESSLKT